MRGTRAGGYAIASQAPGWLRRERRTHILVTELLLGMVGEWGWVRGGWVGGWVGCREGGVRWRERERWRRTADEPVLKADPAEASFTARRSHA